MAKVLVKSISYKQWLFLVAIAIGEFILLDEIGDLTLFLLYAHTVTIVYNNIYLYYATKRTLLFTNIRNQVIIRKGSSHFYLMSFSLSIISMALYLVILSMSLVYFVGIIDIGNVAILMKYILYSMGIYIIQEIIFFVSIDLPLILPLPYIVNLMFHYIVVPILF